MQQDQLGQLAGASAVGDGAAQQCPNIRLIAQLAGHAVGAFVIVEGGDRKAPTPSAMVAGLGQDAAAGAATDEPGVGKTGLERMTQYRGIVCLGKIDQQQRREMG